MVSPPWYIMPGPDEIMEHYRKVLAASPLPVLLYNIPRRTGVGFTVDMVDRLADDPRVVGIKESSKDWGLLSSVIRRTRDRISVFAGYASFFGLAALCEGAVGYVDSATPVFGTRSLAFYRAATTGDLETARRIQAEMEQMLGSVLRTRHVPGERQGRARSSRPARAGRPANRSARSTRRSATRCARR